MFKYILNICNLFGSCHGRSQNQNLIGISTHFSLKSSNIESYKLVMIIFLYCIPIWFPMVSWIVLEYLIRAFEILEILRSHGDLKVPCPHICITQISNAYGKGIPQKVSSYSKEKKFRNILFLTEIFSKNLDHENLKIFG